MEVILLEEYGDGSASFRFDLSTEEKTAFVQLGIITALREAANKVKEENDS